MENGQFIRRISSLFMEKKIVKNDSTGKKIKEKKEKVGKISSRDRKL